MQGHDGSFADPSWPMDIHALDVPARFGQTLYAIADRGLDIAIDWRTEAQVSTECNAQLPGLGG